MKRSQRLDPGSLNDLIDELTAEAGSNDEQIWNFQQALKKHIWLPCEGFVIGEPVSVIAFEYDGNQRRAVTATCRRADGREYNVAASEVVIPPSLPGADCLAAYRQWMGLPPILIYRYAWKLYARAPQPPSSHRRSPRQALLDEPQHASFHHTLFDQNHQTCRAEWS